MLSTIVCCVLCEGVMSDVDSWAGIILSIIVRDNPDIS